ncbi:MAG: metal-dependent transcriptional regulator [Melioribacteraceae bacterium]|nr:metal-dependent transcriptional regulator [Melioribacteraceae bacterium]
MYKLKLSIRFISAIEKKYKSMIYLLITIIVLLIGIIIYSEFTKKQKINNQKILIEDSLKHIYDCEHRNTDCTNFSLSGSLSLSKEKTSKIIDLLIEKKLINVIGNKFRLTSEGKNYALQVIRIHRLWEKYLAEKTSVGENEWHTIAEIEEHNTSIEKANKLAAQLGNPFLDPHGDPIPNENGEIIYNETLTLNQVKINSIVKVEHIEDEPKETYKKLFNNGIYIGTILKVKNVLNEKIIIEVNGKELSLSISEADNINVSIVSEVNYENVIPLSSLKIDESAVISFLSNGIRGQQRRRLLDLGIVPNTIITARMKSLNDDPTAYEVRGTLIALRKNQSDLIFVKKNES